MIKCYNLYKRMFDTLKYFLDNDAVGVIKMSNLLYTANDTFLNTDTERKTLGLFVQLLMNPTYVDNCQIIFDVSYKDIIRCIDPELLKIYLQTTHPPPHSL